MRCVFASIRSWKMPYRKFDLTVGNLLASLQQRRMRPKRLAKAFSFSRSH
jgi:hypothetical protein